MQTVFLFLEPGSVCICCEFRHQSSRASWHGMSDDASSLCGHRGCLCWLSSAPRPLSCLGTCPLVVSIFTVVIITTILECFNPGMAPGVCILHSCALQSLQKLPVVLFIQTKSCPLPCRLSLCCVHQYRKTVVTVLLLALILAPYLVSLGFPQSSVGKESACNAEDPGSTPITGKSTGEGIGYLLRYSWASLVAQLVKNLPAVWETWVWSLGWEDPPREGKGYPLQCSGLENPMDCIIHGVLKSGTRLSDFHSHSLSFPRECLHMETLSFSCEDEAFFLLHKWRMSDTHLPSSSWRSGVGIWYVCPLCQIGGTTESPSAEGQAGAAVGSQGHQPLFQRWEGWGASRAYRESVPGNRAVASPGSQCWM